MCSTSSRVQPSPSSGSISLNLIGPRSSASIALIICRVLRRLTADRMNPPVWFEKQRCERLARHGLGQQISLQLLAAELGEPLRLLLGFYPFGDGAHVERVGEVDHRLGNRHVLA